MSLTALYLETWLGLKGALIDDSRTAASGFA
jgi:hypothetical protein